MCYVMMSWYNEVIYVGYLHVQLNHSQRLCNNDLTGISNMGENMYFLFRQRLSIDKRPSDWMSRFLFKEE